MRILPTIMSIFATLQILLIVSWVCDRLRGRSVFIFIFTINLRSRWDRCQAIGAYITLNNSTVNLWNPPAAETDNESSADPLDTDSGNGQRFIEKSRRRYLDSVVEPVLLLTDRTFFRAERIQPRAPINNYHHLLSRPERTVTII